ncbi:hypothetical protein [Streptomyces sp. TLI_171]|uniref:hypothetical protein n=1 Tax=Streptomyces sp. TLI_171 TaxID=1938859 RepID=UPI000C1A8523|nr:hypothetical protein [Streptomyces sp. TLI_171]RKE17650.1 hypothetical protein BX266_0912 [Streptomyces sp. TLI_171]
MPHPRRPSVRALTRRQFSRRQEPYRRRSRATRRNPLRRGVDRARRRAVALACLALVPCGALAAGVVALLCPARGPYCAVSGAVLGLLLFGSLAGTVAAALRWRLRALERRAADSWARSWRRVEPLWSGRALPWLPPDGP